MCFKERQMVQQFYSLFYLNSINFELTNFVINNDSFWRDNYNTTHDTMSVTSKSLLCYFINTFPKLFLKHFFLIISEKETGRPEAPWGEDQNFEEAQCRAGSHCSAAGGEGQEPPAREPQGCVAHV